MAGVDSGIVFAIFLTYASSVVLEPLKSKHHAQSVCPRFFDPPRHEPPPRSYLGKRAAAIFSIDGSHIRVSAGSTAAAGVGATQARGGGARPEHSGANARALSGSSLVASCDDGHGWSRS